MCRAFLGCSCKTLSVRAQNPQRSKLRVFSCRFSQLRYETQVRSGQAIVQVLLRVQGSTVASESLRHRLRAEFPGCCGSGAFGYSFPGLMEAICLASLAGSSCGMLPSGSGSLGWAAKTLVAYWPSSFLPGSEESLVRPSVALSALASTVSAA